MNTLFLTEGGKSIGLGHLMRCTALSQALKDAYPDAGVNFIVQGDRTAKDFLLKNNIKASFSPWQNKEKSTLAFAKEHDFIVIDSYKAREELYRKISEVSGGRLLMLDDFDRIKYPAGVVVTPSLYPVKKGNKNGLKGKEYIILRREFKNAPRKIIRKNVKDIMITLGGKDYGNFIPKLTEKLLSKYSFNIHIVTSGKNGKVKTLKKYNGKMKSYQDLSALQMRRLMMKSDLAISAGGQTLYELSRCGVPIIGIGFARNQKINLNAFNSKGCMRHVGYHDEKDIFRRLEKAVNELMDYRLRRKMSEKARRLIDGKGTERTIKSAVKNASSITLKPAAKSDCRDIWLWRNSPKVRKWCFSKERIPFEYHKKWFLEKLKDKNTKIYIARNNKKKKIGQVRFDSKGGTAYINICLNPLYIGKGYGSFVIREATNSFFKNKPRIKEVIAEVLMSNASSGKAFSKAGYKKTSKSGKVIIYKMKREKK